MNARARRGYTLIELSVSLIVASILVAGMGSSVFLATRANNTGLGRYQASSRSGETLSDMSRELSYAVAVNEVASTSRIIECTVPDLTGDSADDILRYSWSGTAGAPLQRTLNGGTPQAVVDNVQACQLTLQKRSKEGGSSTESAETQWVNDASAGSPVNYTVNNTSTLGVYFTPSLPGNATAWRITRLEMRAAQSGTADGVLRVQVRLGAALYLPGAVIEEVVVSESRLPTSTSAHTVLFPGVTTLSPTQSACILFAQDSGTNGAASIEYGVSSTASANTRKISSAVDVLGLVVWSSQASQDVRVKIWGTYTGPPGTGQQQFYFTNVDASLQVGTDTTAMFHHGIPLINLPEAAGP
ncbi:MAG: type II secretion system protein [Planctomycetaceae bacterium]|nr:type II secretion system protein [Planctomycetaceae bacterium]